VKVIDSAKQVLARLIFLNLGTIKSHTIPSKNPALLRINNIIKAEL
jgi:hypothetical protein